MARGKDAVVKAIRDEVISRSDIPPPTPHREKGLQLTAEEIEAFRLKAYELAYRGAKNREIEHMLGIDQDTLASRYKHIIAEGRSRLHFDLREVQIRKAMQGDVTMLIWLGKNVLEQTDRLKNEHEGDIKISVAYEDVPIAEPLEVPTSLAADVAVAAKPAPQFPIPHDVAPIVSHEDQRLKKSGLSAVEEQQIKEYRDSRTVLKRAYPNNSRWN